MNCWLVIACSLWFHVGQNATSNISYALYRQSYIISTIWMVSIYASSFNAKLYLILQLHMNINVT